MRLLHINSAKNWGGGEAHTHIVCRGLKEQGFDVVLACREKSAIKDAFEKDGIKTIQLRLRNALDLGSAYAMARFCRQNNINIIHAHLGRDYWLAAWTKLFNPSVHVVLTRHVLRAPSNSFLHRWLFSQAAKVIAVSHAVEKVILDSKIIGREKVITIYNGINIETFSGVRAGSLRQEIHADANTKIIGIIGQVSPHKGQDLLIKCLPLLLGSGNYIQCVIIGGDFRNGQYINELKMLAQSLGVAERVCFLGERSDIPQLLIDFDVFVLASRQESFGLVVAEAMAAGVPVVATACGGTEELIENGVSGLLVNYGDPASMAAAIMKLLDKELREAVIQAAGAKVTTLCSHKNMIQELIKVYQQLVPGHSDKGVGPH